MVELKQCCQGIGSLSNLSLLLLTISFSQAVLCEEPSPRLPTSVRDTETFGLLFQVESEPTVCHPVPTEHSQLFTDHPQ